ncbi:MAG: CoA-acylating methylmalonate-semialdehyde dehydrogenase [Lachnospirales bacterium]
MKLKFFAGGKWIESKTNKYTNVYNTNTGEVLAEAPTCTEAEVTYAIECANKAYVPWSNTPVIKRIQIFYNIRNLIIEHQEELALLITKEHGKSYDDALGDVLKAKEGTEVAINSPNLLMGECLMDVASGVDTAQYREPLGVFSGITPSNFPAMIPMGWMAPLCIATGNTMVLKLSSQTPMTAMRIAELYKEAGLPDGVINVVTCSRNEVDIFLTHEYVKGISFVGSTEVGSKIYKRGAENGKRVQALCEAKNHALVLRDAPIQRTAAGIINAAFGCAGQRCMALPVIVVEESVADEFIKTLKEQAESLKIGPSFNKDSDLGPVVSQSHKDSIIKWINLGLEEGATMVLDGRQCIVEDYEGGFFIGPTILDNVNNNMAVGCSEIFGPVLCIKRVKNFEEGLKIMNENPFANGSVIYTQNGYFAREFSKRTHGGMVGINIGIPVPVGYFPFSGHKRSFFGDLHCLGKDGVRFYTETKCITTKWFNESEIKQSKVDSWDGTI